MTRRVLVLGGTAEARSLAAELAARGLDVTTSLAGRTRHPRLPAGEVRTGGFGGVAGLAEALADVDVLVDATHPFAATMTEHAAAAASRRRYAADRAAPAGVDRGPGGPLDAGAVADGGRGGDPVRRPRPARDRPPGRRGVRRRRRVVPRPRDRGAGGAAAARRARCWPAAPSPSTTSAPCSTGTRSRSSSPRTPAAPRRPSSSRPASGRCRWCSSTARPCRRA